MRARAADPRVSPPTRVAGLKPGAALAKRRAEGLRGPEFRDARIKRAQNIGISAASSGSWTRIVASPVLHAAFDARRATTWSFQPSSTGRSSARILLRVFAKARSAALARHSWEP